jgi:uncharacterized protein (TIGR02246 family)
MQCIHRAMAFVVMLVVTASCSGPTQRQVIEPSPDISTDKAAILDLEREVFAAEAAGDVERWLACYASDAVLLPPGEHPVVGAEAIRAWAAPFFAAYELHEATDEREVVVSGDWGFLRAHWTWRLTPKDGGETVVDSGMSVWIVQRQPDGAWKIARAIWNGGPEG